MSGPQRNQPWWTGARGEWLVVIQAALIGLLFFGPRAIAGWPPEPLPFRTIALYLGAVLVVIGALLFIAAVTRLGANLTPLPHPRSDATLVQTGVYRYVRHPIYAGGIALAFGWALLRQSWLTVIYAVLVSAFLDVKSRREERWLQRQFPEYREYRRRVRKFVPFLY